MAKSKSPSTIRVLKVRKGATLKEIYAAAHEAFAAADLQKFTETEEYIPARRLLAEMEARDEKEKLKKNRSL